MLKRRTLAMQFDLTFILLSVVVLFWAPIFALAFVFLRHRSIKEEREARFREMDLREGRYRAQESILEVENLRKNVKSINDQINGLESFTHKRLELAAEEVLSNVSKMLPSLVQRHLCSDVQQNTESGLQAIANTNTLTAQVIPPVSAQLNIVRGIAHALFTPLSRIDAITRNVIASHTSPEIDEKMLKASAAVSICYAFVHAYRHILSQSSATPNIADRSLQEVIISSAEVYVENLGTELVLKISAPNSVPGYSNFYILACVLPLVENAIEASEDGDHVDVTLAIEADRMTATISNSLHGSVIDSKAFQPGFSTKDTNSLSLGRRKHEGLGLSIVRNLLGATAGSTLSHSVRDDLVHFVFTLPVSGE